MTTTIYKQLATKQDLAIGKGKVTQSRNGVNVELDEIDFLGPNTAGEVTTYTFKTFDDLLTLTTIGGDVIELTAGKEYTAVVQQPFGTYLVSETTTSIPPSTSIPATTFKAQLISNIQGGAYIIFDDSNLVTKTDCMPVAVANNFKAGLAMYHSGMAASYDFVSLKEANDFKKSVDGELLSHSMNSVVLNDSVDTSYGESMLRTSATEFNKFGMQVRGFVAPSSTLKAALFPELRQYYDYAFIRSVGVGASTAALNFSTDDRHNMVRVALTATNGDQVITLAEAQAYVDLAKKYNAFICFYAHTAPTYLADLMQYIQTNYRNINPAEWIGTFYGLSEPVAPTVTENLLRNSEFKLINSANTNPDGWTVSADSLVGTSFTITDREQPVLDFIGTANNPGDSSTIRQNYFFNGLSKLTAFCFSIYASSLAATNTKVKVAMYLKDGSNVTLASANRIYTIAGNDQRIYVEQTFIPNTSAAYIQVELTIEAIAAGAVRAILNSPQLERNGFYTSYKNTGIEDTYFSVLRKTTGQTIQPNTDTKVIFNGSLVGTNKIFDLTTGDATPADGGNYEFQVNCGLQAMVAGDLVEFHLLENGAPTKKANFVCAVGTNIFNPSWTVRGSASTTYAIGIRHNSSAGRAITTFSDATLTVTAR